MVAGPNFGSYAMRFEGTIVANDPYYPSDGRGGKTTTVGDSFVRDAGLTIITRIDGGRQSANHTLRIFDEDDNEVWQFFVNSTTEPQWPFPFGQDGIVLQGNWYVTADVTAVEWAILFQVKEGR